MAAGLTFTPQFANPVSLAADFYGADFYANQPRPGGGTRYSISGQVTDPVNGVAGVEVRGGGMATTTDSSGNYQLNNFVNGNYTIVPQNGGWSFSPINLSVIINSTNSSSDNFSRVAPYSVSGSFTGLPTGHGSVAPTVYLSNGRSVTATLQGSGTKTWGYTLASIPAGQFSLTAELAGYKITPAGFTNPLAIAGSFSGMNFSGVASGVAGAIIGRVTQQGQPVTGALLQAIQSGSTIGSAMSDSDGYFRIENLADGSYTVVPTKAGYLISPVSLNVVGIPATGINFAATGPIAPPAISSVTANPSVVSNSSGNTVLSAVANGAVPLSYSWDAVTAAAPVTFGVNDSSNAASTTVSFLAPGSYTFRVRVTDTNGLPASNTVSVIVSAGAGAMAVSPYQVQVAAGQSVTFQAAAWDQLGNQLTVSPAWSVSGGGNIDNTGFFTATSPGGPYTVTAVTGSLSASAFVWVTSSAMTVTNGPVLSISLSNSIITISWQAIVGQTYRIQYKNDFSDSTWSTLGPDVTANAATASTTDVVGTSPHFYRLMLVQ
jgi:hypothetical protein